MAADLRLAAQAGPQAPADDVYRRMVASVDHHAMIVLDREGLVMSWNPGAERIKGYAADEIVGLSFETFYPPEAIAVDHPSASSTSLRSPAATRRPAGGCARTARGSGRR